MSRIRKLSPRVVGVAFILAMLAISGCGRNPEVSAKHLAAGKALLEQGNFDKARVELKNAVKRDPNRADPYYWLGLTFEKLNDPRQAFAHFLKAHQLDPGHLDAAVKSGTYYAMAGETDKALEVVKAIEAIDRESVEAKLIRSRVAYRKDDLKGAIQYAEQAVGQEPYNVAANVLLSALYSLNGQSDKATALVSDALKSLSDSMELRSQYVRLLVTSEELTKALPWMEENVRLDPANLEHRLLLARAYVKLGQKDKAEAVTARAVEELPDNLTAKLLHVDFLGQIRSPERAEQALLGYIAANPKDPALRFKLAEQYAGNGKLDLAEETYREILKHVEGKAHIIAAKNALAVLHVRKNEIDQAKSTIDGVLKEYPDNPSTLLLRGKIALAEGKSIDAIADLRAALKADFNSVEIRRLLAQAHLLQNEIDQARDNLQRAVEQDPRDVPSLNALAQLLIQKQQYADAGRLLDQAQAVDPKSADVRLTRFRLKLAQNDRKGALQLAKEAQQDLPDSPLGYFLAGLMHKLDSDTTRSTQELLQAVRTQPDAGMALVLLVDNLVGEKRFAEAEGHLNKALQAQPENAFLHNFLGLVRQKRQDYAGAVAAFQSASEAKPEWWTPYRNTAESYFEAGDAQSAVNVYKQALQKLPGKRDLLINLAVLHERVGQLDEAIGIYEKFLAQEPDHLVATNNLALLLANRRGDPESLKRAEALADKLVKVEHPEIWDTRGWILHRAGKRDQALELLRKAVNAAPNNGGYQYHLALVYQSMGEVNLARKHLQTALTLGLDRESREQATVELAKLEKPLR